MTPPGAPAPALARLFTPLQAPGGAYVVTVLPQGIEAALAAVKSALAPTAVAGNPEGSWRVREASPLEAFGTAGTYDRGKVARLYGGRRVSLVRGPVERDGRVVAGVTLISPYPDATLTRLEPGTLLIVVRVDGRAKQPATGHRGRPRSLTLDSAELAILVRWNSRVPVGMAKRASGQVSTCGGELWIRASALLACSLVRASPGARRPALESGAKHGDPRRDASRAGDCRRASPSRYKGCRARHRA